MVCRHPSSDASSDVQRFQRPSGWSADEVARLRQNDPHLLEDQNLATWREMIVVKACKYARRCINRVFPENSKYAFCKLPQWPTVMPWIAGIAATRRVSACGPGVARVAPVPLAPDAASATIINGPHQFCTFSATSVSVPGVDDLTSTAESLQKKSSIPSGESPCPIRLLALHKLTRKQRKRKHKHGSDDIARDRTALAHCFY